jgi:hypothetical protein
MKIVDLSILKKDDFVIKAITGEEYHIDGNFSTEFYLSLYDSYQKVQDSIKNGDNRAATELLKTIALEILKLDTSKEVTMETLKQQKFDSFEVLQYLLTACMNQANKITSDPNSNSPTSV